MENDKPYKILIVEDDPDYAEPLRDCFNKTEEFKVLGVTDSATIAYRLVKSGLPDVVLVDLELKEGDGFDLLARISDPEENWPLPPYIIVLTEFQAKTALRKIKSGLANFLFKKENEGYSPELLLRHLTIMQDQFARNRKPEQPRLDSSLEKEALLRGRIEAELDQYYIRQGAQGREYVAEMIYKAVVLPKHEKLQITQLYIEVGKLYQNDPHNVTMSVNRLLQSAFNKTAPEDLARVYTPYVDIERGAPQVNEFVAYTANKIRSEHIC